jgi:hypothetical protein
MLDVSEGFNGVSAIELKRGAVSVHEKGNGRVLRVPAKSFL